MRPHGTDLIVAVNQVWASNDPRRLSAFKVIEVHRADRFIIAEAVYPSGGRLRTIALEAFRVTGPKGYRRIS